MQTAAVRRGVKPAELLRVRHCYAQTNAEGFRFCLYRRDIYFTLRLAYVELKVEEASSLVLFPGVSARVPCPSSRRLSCRIMSANLPSECCRLLLLDGTKFTTANLPCQPHNRRWLVRMGYPAEGTAEDFLRELVRRARGETLPHEVGVFVGYPLKDVIGFVRRLPATPLHNGPWRIYGSRDGASLSARAAHASTRA